MKGLGITYRGFSEAFRAWGSPTPRSCAGDAGRPLYGARSTMFNGLAGLLLRLLGVPIVYTTVSRINSAFPAIGSVSNITSGVIAQYATDVEAEIDAIISTRYALPIVGTCPILTAIATRETIYRIAVQRALVQFPPAQQGKAPLQVQHEDDQKLLGKIASGEVGLVTSAGVVVIVGSTQIPVYSTTMNYLPTFHEGDWGNMNVDTNKLIDIDSDRNL